MSTIDSATYIVGYLTSIAAIGYLAAHVFDKPKICENIAYWFFIIVVWFKLFAIICDWVIKR